jgi:transposase
VTALASGSGEIARDPRRGLTEPLGSERTWAIESAGGLGKLLAQQLLEAGEQVVDVPPTLAARVRLLGSTKASKNDSNDALATALAGVAALRAAGGAGRGPHRGAADADRPLRPLASAPPDVPELATWP